MPLVDETITYAVCNECGKRVRLDELPDDWLVINQRGKVVKETDNIQRVDIILCSDCASG